MNPEQQAIALIEATQKLKALETHCSDEDRHIQADEVILNLLTQLGHHAVVEAYRSIKPKFYA
jgi:hypothetical protein